MNFIFIKVYYDIYPTSPNLSKTRAFCTVNPIAFKRFCNKLGKSQMAKFRFCGFIDRFFIIFKDNLAVFFCILSNLLMRI